jgi:prevent-host-death family protein
VRAALKTHLKHAPGKTSRGRIKRLRGLRRPQYRLRVGGVRVFYDVSSTSVGVLAIVAKLEAGSWLAQFENPEWRKFPLSEIKDDLSHYFREAETQELVITRHGKPAGVLIGFESEEDWFDYRFEHDPRFLRRIDRRGTACALDAK